MKKINKQFKIELIVLTIGLLLLGLGIFFAYKYNLERIRADLNEQKLNSYREVSQKRYERDSLDMVIKYNLLIIHNDSIEAFTNNEFKKINPIKKYYNEKIHSIQIAPSSIVDKQFDSLLTDLRHRYN